MSLQVKALWKRLHAALAMQAPERLNSLAKPAATLSLSSFEAEIGASLPADLRASWGVHDGQNPDSDELYLFGDFPFFSVAQSRAERLMQFEIHGSAREADDFRAWAFMVKEDIGVISGPVKAFGQSPLWVPIGSVNGDVFRFVDLDPAPGGAVGQVIEVDPESVSWRVLAPSFADFLERFVTAVERKKLDWDDFDAGSGTLFPEPRQKMPDYLKSIIQTTKPAKIRPLKHALSTLKVGERVQVEASIARLTGDISTRVTEIRVTDTGESVWVKSDAQTVGFAQVTMRSQGIFDLLRTAIETPEKPRFYVERFQRIS